MACQNCGHYNWKMFFYRSVQWLIHCTNIKLDLDVPNNIRITDVKRHINQVTPSAQAIVLTEVIKYPILKKGKLIVIRKSTLQALVL